MWWCIQTAHYAPAAAAVALRRSRVRTPYSAAGIEWDSNPQQIADLLRRIHEGEEPAVSVVEQAGRYLGIAVAPTARVANISAVVPGGHFAALEEWIAPALRRSLDHYAPGLIPGRKRGVLRTGADGGAHRLRRHLSPQNFGPGLRADSLNVCDRCRQSGQFHKVRPFDRAFDGHRGPPAGGCQD